MHRSMIFLVFAFLIGLVLIFARMKGHESQYGGIGRYQGRGDKDAEHVEDPVRQFEDVFYQENDLPIRGRLSDSSSLKDLLLILNELNQKAAAEKHAQQEPPPPDSNTQESGSQDSGMSPH